MSGRDVGRSFIAAVFTFLLYDYTLTIGREIDLFWKRSWRSWTFFLFIANRYITLFGHVPSLVYLFWSPQSYFSRCTTLCNIIQAEIFVIQIVGGVIMTIRVYALHRNSRRVLIFLVTLILAAGVIGCWSLFSPQFNSSASKAPVPLQNSTANVDCLARAFSFSSDQARSVAITWTGQLVFDIAVFLLTLVQTLRNQRPGRRSIIDVILFDGCLYFAVVCCGVIANIIALLVSFSDILTSSIQPGSDSATFYQWPLG
ncbi:hypothetical protein SCLCIDRAFT_1219628 [Scleroderma citrinum Foug A]|uniref:DUF6533 domain-containing protein n=1 Tax=Scleroderma citrinum Foug A TaxID=1036808 RepID=A0A0C3DLS5_9AGAM|nr:hypothetical protein SCLCIDRAFT_1219628 [Scleroderma citrinum Foug A]